MFKIFDFNIGEIVEEKKILLLEILWEIVLADGKLHDYESSITKQKEIEDYESPEEVLTIGDTVITIVYDTFSETLNITDGTTIIEKNDNNYGTGTYGSQYPSNNTSGSVYVSG